MKIMLLTIDGGTETYKIGPMHSLVAVQDVAKYRDEVRRAATHILLDDSKFLAVEPFEARHEILRSLHVTLTDSGLKHWPETGTEITALLERMSNAYSRPGAR